jgi:hypothetical protein
MAAVKEAPPAIARTTNRRRSERFRGQLEDSLNPTPATAHSVEEAVADALREQRDRL